MTNIKNSTQQNDPAAPPKKLIVVLGMHRSGTSALTRGLEVLGVTLGENLMPPAENNNEKGFFEDLEITKINDCLLAKLGSAWDKLASIDEKTLQSSTYAIERQEACLVLKEKLNRHILFAFKDPRISLLLPFWQSIFEELALDVGYILCIRNPLSVADSLQKRDDLPQSIGLFLWLKYTVNALLHTTVNQRLILDYDALMLNPEIELERVRKAFCLNTLSDHKIRLKAYCSDFLTARLRHHTYSSDALIDNPKVPSIVAHLYLDLRYSLNLDDGKISRAIPESLRNLWSEINPLLTYVDSLKEKIDQEVQLIGLKNECVLLEKALNTEKTLQKNMHYQHQNTQKTLQEQQTLYTNILKSHSWRITRPLRALRRHYRQPIFLIRILASKMLRSIWRKLPQHPLKNKLKCIFFDKSGFTVKFTKAYQEYLRFSASCTPFHSPELDFLELSKISPAEKNDNLDTLDSIVCIPKLLGKSEPPKPATLIAFYLPQFHVIPENNQWWGDGFTEWTNVQPAQMQYQGHYQPHIPGDLGYYNLLDKSVQSQQVALAKQYGVGGFCFYYYWFSGKQLLQAPIEQYLKNTDLDLPFCLCWANEPWTRRWDGLDSEVLIAQSYSEEDDLAFIQSLAIYFKDSRYIRINGRPLLLVYRPHSLPNARKTAARWRSWCHKQGIGEIYLAYTQAFEQSDPARYGFDAAIEFPPNNSSPPDVTGRVIPLTKDFAGHVYDYHVFKSRSKEYTPRKYPLFRGVFPSWDNTARRKNNSTSFINSSPQAYQEWLVDAIVDTSKVQPNPDERLVFINAWNEWAEGAHLEPDQRYGYGFLEATRMAQVRSQLHLNRTSPPSQKIAVVIHAFYPDVFTEILAYLNAVNDFSLKLFISCPDEVSDSIHALVANSQHPYIVAALPNHGRDILPFLKLMPQVLEEGYEYLVKVHTKKSLHRGDGDSWRRDLYDKLLKPEQLRHAQRVLEENPSIGVIGPTGHVVPMSYYWGSNATATEQLAARMGARSKDLSGFTFVAGAMFSARSSSFLPLLNLALYEADFAPEAGQVDGTLAHAIERAISISTWAAGMQVISLDTTTTEVYPFAQHSVPVGT